ncbi:hypothetical protein [Vibrio diabolicus]|uniref:hypothetical protein n=1 Tax=Vibrio diabolicus TaxID=50719 RepID=UPI0035BE5F63
MNRRHPLAFEQCITIENHREHQALVNRLASTDKSAIVVAASGMYEGGKLVNYLKHFIQMNEMMFYSQVIRLKEP